MKMGGKGANLSLLRGWCGVIVEKRKGECFPTQRMVLRKMGEKPRKMDECIPTQRLVWCKCGQEKVLTFPNPENGEGERTKVNLSPPTECSRAKS
jgi:hypothetical protein